jgi:trimeric autotransporter adhesin
MNGLHGRTSAVSVRHERSKPTMCMSRSVYAVLLSCALAACDGGSTYRGGEPVPGPLPPPARGSFTVGGSVQGLDGTVVLANGNDIATVTATAGAAAAFTFSAGIAAGASYNVTVQTHPSNQSCTVANGSGAIGAANVTNVAVTCTDNPAAVQVTADPGVRSVTLSWIDSAASSFNLYQCETRSCDVSSATPILSNVLSPRTIKQLQNGQVYFFRLESIHANGSRALSNVVGARPNALVFDGNVNAMARADDGSVYLGGNFSEVGVASGGAVPLNRTSGRTVIGDFPLVNGQVSAIVADTTGGWYVGGNFTHVDGIARVNLAHILVDGSIDPGFDAHFDAQAEDVTALAYHDGTLYVGGFFDSVGTLPRSAIAALDASTGTAIADFDAKLQGEVVALAVAGEVLYAGGFMVFDDSQRETCIAGLDVRSGILVPGFALTAGNCDIRAIAVAQGTVYVGGSFIEIGGLRRSGVAALDATGRAIETFDALAFPPPTTVISALAVVGNTLYAGGRIGLPADPDNRAVVALDRLSGRAVADFAALAGERVRALAVSADTLYVAGGFTRIGGSDRSRIAALDPASGAVRELDVRANDSVLALAVSGETVYIGGEFNSINSNRRNNLAALNSEGELLSWNPDADGTVNALAATGGAAPTVYAGGDFRFIGGLERPALAAMDSDGNVIDAFNAQAAHAGTSRPIVRALVLGNSGALYVGGSFTSMGQRNRTHLAALNPLSGVAFESFNGQPLAPVNALAATDLTLYVAGEFTQIRDLSVAGGSTHTRSRIAALDPVTGAVQNSFIDGAVGTSVNALSVSGTTVHAGGDFTSIGGQECRNLAALDAQSGQASPTFRPNPNAVVRALGVSGDTLYVGGIFSEIDGVSRSGLAALDFDGRARSVQADVSPGAEVRALTTFDDTVYVGGSFSSIGGQLRAGFTAVAADGTVR